MCIPVPFISSGFRSRGNEGLTKLLPGPVARPPLGPVDMLPPYPVAKQPLDPVAMLLLGLVAIVPLDNVAVPPLGPVAMLLLFSDKVSLCVVPIITLVSTPAVLILNSPRSGRGVRKKYEAAVGRSVSVAREVVWLLGTNDGTESGTGAACSNTVFGIINNDMKEKKIGQERSRNGPN